MDSSKPEIPKLVYGLSKAGGTNQTQPPAADGSYTVWQVPVKDSTPPSALYRPTTTTRIFSVKVHGESMPFEVAAPALRDGLMQEIRKVLPNSVPYAMHGVAVPGCIQLLISLQNAGQVCASDTWQGGCGAKNMASSRLPSALQFIQDALGKHWEDSTINVDTICISQSASAGTMPCLQTEWLESATVSPSDGDDSCCQFAQQTANNSTGSLCNLHGPSAQAVDHLCSAAVHGHQTDVKPHISRCVNALPNVTCLVVGKEVELEIELTMPTDLQDQVIRVVLEFYSEVVWDETYAPGTTKLRRKIHTSCMGVARVFILAEDSLNHSSSLASSFSIPVLPASAAHEVNTLFQNALAETAKQSTGSVVLHQQSAPDFCEHGVVMASSSSPCSTAPYTYLGASTTSVVTHLSSDSGRDGIVTAQHADEQVEQVEEAIDGCGECLGNALDECMPYARHSDKCGISTACHDEHEMDHSTLPVQHTRNKCISFGQHAYNNSHEQDFSLQTACMGGKDLGGAMRAFVWQNSVGALAADMAMITHFSEDGLPKDLDARASWLLQYWGVAESVMSFLLGNGAVNTMTELLAAMEDSAALKLCSEVIYGAGVVEVRDLISTMDVSLIGHGGATSRVNEQGSQESTSPCMENHVVHAHHSRMLPDAMHHRKSHQCDVIDPASSSCASKLIPDRCQDQPRSHAIGFAAGVQAVLLGWLATLKARIESPDAVTVQLLCSLVLLLLCWNDAVFKHSGASCGLMLPLLALACIACSPYGKMVTRGCKAGSWLFAAVAWAALRLNPGNNNFQLISSLLLNKGWLLLELVWVASQQVKWSVQVVAILLEIACGSLLLYLNSGLVQPRDLAFLLVTCMCSLAIPAIWPRPLKLWVPRFHSMDGIADLAIPPGFQEVICTIIVSKDRPSSISLLPRNADAPHDIKLLRCCLLMKDPKLSSNTSPVSSPAAIPWKYMQMGFQQMEATLLASFHASDPSNTSSTVTQPSHSAPACRTSGLRHCHSASSVSVLADEHGNSHKVQESRRNSCSSDPSPAAPMLPEATLPGKVGGGYTWRLCCILVKSLHDWASLGNSGPIDAEPQEGTIHENLGKEEFTTGASDAWRMDPTQFQQVRCNLLVKDVEFISHHSSNGERVSDDSKFKRLDCGLLLK